MSTSAFAAEDFPFLQPGHGAAKLASSAVAPLIAAARGYHTTRRDNLRETSERFRLGSMNSSAMRQLKDAVGDEDAMVMPWFRMDDTLEAARKGTKPSTASKQMRPSSPVYNASGDAAKYLNLAGLPTVLDAHPATPADWMTGAPIVLMTEGIIKGDSTLTAVLRHAGVSEDILRDDHGGDEVLARLALRKAMEQVPEDQQVLIISFVGVANWRSNPEWTAFSLAGRQAWIAYDADVAVNRQVWKQASELMRYLEESRKTQTPVLITVPPVAGDPKAGLDDFFAADPADGGGTWADVAGMHADLPSPPADTDGGADEGEWRVAPDGCSVEESVPVSDASGRTINTRWESRIPIGGRLKSAEVSRIPHEQEIVTGVFGKGVGAEGKPDTSNMAGVEIEVMWRDRHNPNQIRTASIYGPASILNYDPRDWDRKGARIPLNVVSLPAWPPKKSEWLEAVKANREEEVQHRARWTTMGWVPSYEGGPPGFIIGNQLITADGSADGTGVIGISDRELAGAGNLGVLIPDHEHDENAGDEDWKEQAREDLEEVVAAYIDSGAWMDKAVAATTLALGLRPCLPLPSRTSAYLVGRPRSGKSWTAAAAMAFWSPTVPGSWDNNRLPGSGKDTMASHEHAVARTPIWAVDDLAPSANKNQAIAEEAALGDLIRAVHNQTSKRRMNADMTAREVNKPKALLIVTAENEQSVNSVADRLVRMNFGKSSLNPDRSVTQHVLDTYQATGSAPRLSYALIRWIAWKSTQLPGGWAEMYRSIELKKEHAKVRAEKIIAGAAGAGTATRHAEIAADLMITYAVLADFARDVGASKRVRDKFRVSQLPTLVAQQISSGYDSQSQSTIGRNLLEAISNILASGRGHIVNAESPGEVPTDSELRNHLLGWSPATDDGRMRPTGQALGYLVRASDDDRSEVVLLSARTAFNEAQRFFPDSVPHGSKPAQAWASVWDEGLAITREEGGWSQTTNGRITQNTVQVRVGGEPLRGVPVPLKHIVTLAQSSAHTAPEDGEGNGEAEVIDLGAA